MSVWVTCRLGARELSDDGADLSSSEGRDGLLLLERRSRDEADKDTRFFSCVCFRCVGGSSYKQPAVVASPDHLTRDIAPDSGTPYTAVEYTLVRASIVDTHHTARVGAWSTSDLSSGVSEDQISPSPNGSN